MVRLPIPGGDHNTWGDILNEFLRVEHNDDGTQKTVPVAKGGTGATAAAAARTNLGAISSADAQALVDTHVNDTTAAHAATAVSFSPSGTISATNVQSAIQEVAAEAGSSITLSDTNPANLATTPAPGTSSEVSRSDHVHSTAGLATDAELSSHATTTTGIHGVGASTIESTAGSQAKVDTHAALTATHGATGAVVGTTNTQTLTNKTLTSPVINTPTGITKGDVGLANVDNTSDANKPVSTAQQTALDTKVAKAGDTMTGALTLPGDPTNALHAATKQYVDAGDAAAIPKSLVDAKGDLVVGSAADTVVRLAAGANDQILTADSTETSGMKWAAVPLGINLAYPHQATAFSDITPQHIAPSTTYTVPSGKVLYITEMNASQQFTINGLQAVSNARSPDARPPNPYIVAAAIDVVTNPNCSLFGFLMDARSDIVPLYRSVRSDDVYTVPIGKMFILLNAFSAVAVRVSPDGVSAFIDIGALSGNSSTSIPGPFLSSPVVVPASGRVDTNTTTGTRPIFGYEVIL